MHNHNRHESGSAAQVDGGEPTLAAESQQPAVTIPYRANLLGNIEQALKGLQGYGIMALELIQNADDAGSKRLFFDARDDALVVGNSRTRSAPGFKPVTNPV